MLRIHQPYLTAAMLSCGVLVSGCAPLSNNLEQERAQLVKERESLQQREDAVNAREAQLKQLSASAGSDSATLLPPMAKAGECYARVFVPPVYKTETETVLKKAASERIEVVPAVYGTKEQRVLVKEADRKVTVVPAKYKTETETVMVSDRSLVWRTSLKPGAPEASQALLNTAQKYGINLKDAKPGQCFHEHYTPATFETVYKDELVSEESYRIELVPARYEMVEERVLVAEETTRLVSVPATYKWAEEKVLVREAYVDWKKGRGLIEKIDNTTGEIMCRVEVPAEYKIVKKQVVDQPARVEKQVIPAVYKTVKVRKMVAPASEKKVLIPAKYKKVGQQQLAEKGHLVWHEVHDKSMSKNSRTGNRICLVEKPAQYRKVSKKVVVTPAKTVVTEIPAVYKTVKVKVVESAAQERKVKIPAEYQQVSYQRKVSPGQLQWRQVLCETNTTPDVVRKLQSALERANFSPGKIDGVYGRSTAAAVESYQQAKGLATGGLTYETLKSLGL